MLKIFRRKASKDPVVDKFGWIPRRTIKRAYTSLNTKFDDADIVKFGVVGLLPQPRGNWDSDSESNGAGGPAGRNLQPYLSFMIKELMTLISAVLSKA